jgi:hypothetical protein
MMFVEAVVNALNLPSNVPFFYSRSQRCRQWPRCRIADGEVIEDLDISASLSLLTRNEMSRIWAVLARPYSSLAQNDTCQIAR